MFITYCKNRHNNFKPTYKRKIIAYLFIKLILRKARTYNNLLLNYSMQLLVIIIGRTLKTF